MFWPERTAALTTAAATASLRMNRTALGLPRHRPDQLVHETTSKLLSSALKPCQFNLNPDAFHTMLHYTVWTVQFHCARVGL
jgi:hypothetical protein